MFGLGMPELVVILVIVVILFGANKLPGIGKGIGEGIKNFKDSIKHEDRKAIDTENTENTKNTKSEKSAEVADGKKD